MQKQLVSLAALAALALAGCDDPLTVENENSPDVDRAYATPAGVETIVSKIFQQMHQGQYGSSDALWSQTVVMSFESYSSLNNFGMNVRGGLPRQGIENTRGNNVQGGNFRDFDFLTRNARSAATAITAINRFVEEGATIGSPARDARAKSFAFFTLGFGLGNVSLFYDSAAVVTPLPPEAPLSDSALVPPYSTYSVVNEAALAALDSALAIANSQAATDGANGWPIPAEWMSSPDPAGVSLDQWKRILYSYKARFRAGVARTPAERGAVDWTTVISDATAGIQMDLNVLLSTGAGWTNAFIQQAAVPGGWHQMPYFFIGMADTSGAYEAWLSTPLTSRSPFTIQTADKRFPQGSTRAAQQAFQSATAPAPGVYFRNRPSTQDTPGDPWGTSQYDNFRYYGIRANAGNGNFAIMTKPEIDMLAAEGYLRTGQGALAASLIDITRVRNGLASVAGLADSSAIVPGGAACVPGVPAPPSFTTTECGTLFEAMKYEKRMETAFTGYAQWYLDSRGWGDLATGTPLQWPIPFQERDARGVPAYTIDDRAASGNYGF